MVNDKDINMKTKVDLLQDIATKANINNTQVNKFFSAFQEVIENYLSEGQDVKIHKMFQINIVYKKSRVGTNPQTLEKITIPAGYSASIKLSDKLKLIVKDSNGNGNTKGKKSNTKVKAEK